MPHSLAAPHIAQQTLSREDLSILLTAKYPPRGFEQCTFDGADLSGLNFRDAHFVDCTFAETSFEKSVLTGTRWWGCKARQADFHLADLTNARFCRSDLNNTGWLHAKLCSALFTEVKLTRASFFGSNSLGLRFSESVLVGANLRGISFRCQLVKQLDLSDADLAGCDFRAAIFEGGSLRDANLRNTRFGGADLRSIDLGSLEITTTAHVLKGATISAKQAEALVRELGVRVV